MNPDQSDQGREDQANRGFGGRKIPRFVEGGSKPLIFSAADMNVLVDAINRLMSMRITRGSSDLVIHTDSEVIIQLAYPKGELSVVTTA